MNVSTDPFQIIFQNSCQQAKICHFCYHPKVPVRVLVEKGVCVQLSNRHASEIWSGYNHR